MVAAGAVATRRAARARAEARRRVVHCAHRRRRARHHCQAHTHDTSTYNIYNIDKPNSDYLEIFECYSIRYTLNKYNFRIVFES